MSLDNFGDDLRYRPEGAVYWAGAQVEVKSQRGPWMSRDDQKEWQAWAMGIGGAGGAIRRPARSRDDEIYDRNAANLRRYAERRGAHLARLADQDFADHNEQAKGRRVK